MKKFNYIIILFLMCFVLISCQDKKPTSLCEFQEKYKNKKIQTCEELVNAHKEFSDIFYDKIDKAYLGDQAALEDIIQSEILDEDPFADAYTNLETECANEIAEVQRDLYNKTGEYLDRIFAIIDNIYENESETKVEE